MAEIQKQSAGALENLAAEINAEHRAFVGSLKKTAEHGIRAGELLTEAKSEVRHGQWLPWLEQNFDGAPRTAQTYMQLYNKRDELRAKTQSSAHLSIDGALKEIAAPQEEEKKPEPEKEELSDEQVIELVRTWMELQGPTELSDIEQAALERRLAKVGERERDLLSEIQFEHMMMYGCQVAQDGFILAVHDDKEVVECRSPDKKKLHRFALPEPGKTKLPESERARVKRGTKVYGVLKFQMWRLLSNWFTEVLIAEVDDLEKVEGRITHNADWKQVEPAGEFLRDRMLHEGFRSEAGKDKRLNPKKWALRHQVVDVQEFMNQVYTIERVWCRIEAKRLEDGLMGAED